MSDKINPWLLRRAPSSPSPDRQDSDREPLRTGPDRPQRGGRVPDPAFRIGVHEQHGPPASLWVLGVHGGAGESTIAALRPGWSAAGHGFPATIPSINRSGGPDRLVLTCRSHVPGLSAAQAALIQWAGGAIGWLELLGLVIIADAPGTLPKPARDLATVVAGGAPRCWRLPWSEAWRMGENPPPAELPRPVRRLLSDLDALVGSSDAPAPPSIAGIPPAPEPEFPDSVSLEGIHHARSRNDHPADPTHRGVRPVADPR
ncbi:DUF6668 family protein [Microlunatus soli]|uniref:Uncharacterized protein n=1 Tax=Microlunatus soli TaxID=630515 RepID=A0A1H1UGD7_9ACTN|nr:DUF6668 family protein [Microlunatus soli]SDS71585.1 hypothetical protein SAMN04489812_2779 [Microlunatus soli]